MCGFFGVVDFSGGLKEQDHKEIHSGVEVISYRGPDDVGAVMSPHLSIGFNRLSIIDLSAPCQPYKSVDGSIAMVCNGEIYNYRSLRDELINKGHVFRTQTDSEVVIHGFQEWESGIWERLNGIFAIALWNEKERRLHLVRDRLGVKPLHFLKEKTRVYFGSAYNCFLKQTFKDVEFNPQAVLSYLSFRYSIGEQTFYKGIYDLLPGVRKAFSPDGAETHVYWDIPREEEGDKGEEYYLLALEEKMGAAVRKQLMSDVPLGAFISGGLDSSLLLYYMARENTEIISYISGFPDEDYNEFRYADMMARSLNIRPRKLTLTLEDYMSDMEEVVLLRGEPVSVPHEAAFLKMSRFLKKEITVVLSGEGADELFGGYGRIFRSPHDYYKQRLANRAPFFKKTLGALLGTSNIPSFDSPLSHFLWRYSWFTEKDKKDLLNMDYFGGKFFDNYSFKYVSELFDKVARHGYYKAMYYVLGKLHLVNLLNRLDRMTMGASVEARVPFLDHDLVEFVSRMPSHHKLKWKGCLGWVKSISKTSDAVSENNDIPKFILKRLARGKVPEEIIKRKKMGFPVPLDKWCSLEMKKMALELLTGRDSKTREFTNAPNLTKFLTQDNYQSEYDYDGKKIWMLMNLEIWMRKAFAG